MTSVRRGHLLVAAALLATAACTGGSKVATTTSTTSAPAGAAVRSAGQQSSAAARHSVPSSAPAPSPTGAKAASRLTARVLPGRLAVALSRVVTLPRPDGGLELLGGLLNGDHSSNQVRRVALPSGAVTADGTLAVGVHDSAGAVVGGRFLVYAGGAAQEVATIQQAVPGGAATRAGALPQPRSDLAVAVVGKTVVVIGGYDGTHTLADVLASSDGVHFRVLARLPVPVRYPAVLVRGHSVLVYGGDVARKPVDDIQQVDVAGGHATLVGHLPAPLSHEAAFDLAGSTWLVGGTGSQGATARILRSTDGLAFSSAGQLPSPLSDAGAATVNGVGYLVGGETATSRTSSILRLTPG